MRTITPRLAALILGGVAALLAGAQEPHTAAEHDAPHGKSKQDILLQDPLYAVPGKQAHLLRIEYPPGWVGQRHYHTGDVFLYVLSGGFTIDVDGAKRTTIRAGEAYHEALNKVMQARNASTSEATTILLFQVGDEGERMTVVTDR
jgi:quercetin dioxygenase-like cupin family protein